MAGVLQGGAQQALTDQDARQAARSCCYADRHIMGGFRTLGMAGYSTQQAASGCSSAGRVAMVLRITCSAENAGMSQYEQQEVV